MDEKKDGSDPPTWAKGGMLANKGERRTYDYISLESGRGFTEFVTTASLKQVVSFHIDFTIEDMTFSQKSGF